MIDTKLNQFVYIEHNVYICPIVLIFTSTVVIYSWSSDSSRYVQYVKKDVIIVVQFTQKEKLVKGDHDNIWQIISMNWGWIVARRS